MDTRYARYLQNNVHVRQEHLLQLLPLVGRKKLAKGEILLAAGEVCKRMFFVETGLARLYAVDGKGKEHIIQFAPENWFISERGSLYFGTPSAYFLDVLEDSELVVFDQAYLDHASAISTEFRTYHEYLLQNHIRQLQRRIELLIGAPAEQRYLEFVSLYPDLANRIPQWMIASYLGITAESLSRVRKNLSGR